MSRLPYFLSLALGWLGVGFWIEAVFQILGSTLVGKPDWISVLALWVAGFVFMVAGVLLVARFKGSQTELSTGRKPSQ